MNNKFLPICILFIFSILCGIGAGIGYIKLHPSDLTRAEAMSPPAPIHQEETKPPEFITPEKTEPEENTDAEVYQSEQYVVTLSDTKIIIYKVSHDGSMQTVEEKNIDVGSIPSSDYGKLYSGIVCNSLEEAKILVEDYIT